jgi:hypothetical protein
VIWLGLVFTPSRVNGPAKLSGLSIGAISDGRVELASHQSSATKVHGKLKSTG